jgi:diacylglycerol kinase family enzyme
MHMVRIVRSHYPPKITLKVDGQTRLTDQEGFLIVANNKQYALGAEFAPEADSRRRELVARFFPYRNAPLYFWWCLRCLLRFRNNSQSTPFFKGKRFEIEIDNKDGYPVQTDGELIGRCQRLLISTTDDRIRVLRP